MLHLFRPLATALMLALAFSAPLSAQESPASPGPADREKARRAEVDAAFDAAMKAGKAGPQAIRLIDQADLNLPEGYIYVPKAEGDRLMRAFGNRTGSQFLGLVLPKQDVNWFVTLDFAKVGYVKDDEAKDWQPDNLLQSLREGTESGNEDRVARGFAPVEVTHWVEPPFYFKESHRLVWAANLRRKGEASGGSVNYNTYALGRDGYIELNMVGSGDVVAANKGRAKDLLAALEYLPGKAYTDFNPSTDKVAAYGLTALVVGAAAKKLGLLAVLGVALAKFGKLIAIGGVALVAGLGKLFGRNKT